MEKMQRDKGKQGEREVVQIMQSLDWTEARRSRQSDEPWTRTWRAVTRFGLRSSGGRASPPADSWTSAMRIQKKIPTASRWYLCGKTVGNG